MLDVAVPLFLCSKMHRRNMFDSVAATPGPHGPWGAVFKALTWGPDHLWHSTSRKVDGVRLVHPQDELRRFISTEYGITAYIMEKLLDQPTIAGTYKVFESVEAERGSEGASSRCCRRWKGAGGDSENVVVDDDGRGIADMVGLNEPAAEYMTRLDHEDEIDTVKGSLETTVGSGGAVCAFRGAGHRDHRDRLCWVAWLMWSARRPTRA